MTSLEDAAGEQIRTADRRLAELEARTLHLADEERLARFRGDLSRVQGLEAAKRQVEGERAHLQRERAKWVGTLAHGRHPVSIAR